MSFHRYHCLCPFVCLLLLVMLLYHRVLLYRFQTGNNYNNNRKINAKMVTISLQLFANNIMSTKQQFCCSCCCWWCPCSLPQLLVLQKPLKHTIMAIFECIDFKQFEHCSVIYKQLTNNLIVRLMPLTFSLFERNCSRILLILCVLFYCKLFFKQTNLHKMSTPKTISNPK